MSRLCMRARLFEDLPRVPLIILKPTPLSFPPSAFLSLTLLPSPLSRPAVTSHVTGQAVAPCCGTWCARKQNRYLKQITLFVHLFLGIVGYLIVFAR